MRNLNWDDLRFFLAVCRQGSIRGAARVLEVNHATVSRRINSFEKSIGGRLFERTAQGYIRTTLADEIFGEASYLEERLFAVERRMVGKENELTGDIRVTFPDVLGGLLLMPDFAEFCRLYPNIQLEIVDSLRTFNLANREADVAFRVCEEPPEYLIGRKLASIHHACYIAKSHSKNIYVDGWLEQQNWLGWSDKQSRPIGKIAKDYLRLGSKHKIMSVLLQAEACKNEMGVSVLPCFLADKDPALMRIPPYSSEAKYDLWILSHPDMRNNGKIKTFVRFMTERVLNSRELIEGKCFESTIVGTEKLNTVLRKFGA